MKTLILVIAQASLLMVVASVGLRAQWRDVIASIRKPKLLVRGIVAVNLVVPATAVLLCAILPMEQPVKIGIAIMAVSPLAPLLTGKMVKAGVEASSAIGLYVALVLLAIVIVPATIAVLSWIFPADASISVRDVAALAARTVLAPLAAGLLLGTMAPRFARPLSKMLMMIGYAGLALVAIAILYARGSDILALVGDGAVLAIIVTVIAGLAAGHLLGGPEPSGRTALALAATTRHPGLAAMIAQQNFGDPKVLPAIILFLLTSVTVSTAYLAWFARKPGSRAKAAA